MPTAGFLLGLSVLYLGLLFAAATWADRRAAAGRSVARNALVYKLSLAVYCSAWTFYGGGGPASREGLAFLPIYLGPTLTALLFPFVLQKVLRVAKAQGTTSIADFVAARYGKSGLLAGLVAVIAVVAAVPYIALQLKALDASVEALLPAGGAVLAARLGADIPPLVALVLALFCVLFGTRTIDATERHEGLVVAVALESLVKLVALLAVGAFVTWGLSGGLADLGARYLAAGHGPALTIGGRMGYADWFLLTLVSALAFLVLPRQFHVAVIENLREDHARSASWLLPLYLLLISLFMLPVAMAGALGGTGDPDLFVLSLPLDAGRPALALLAYLGGLSASAAMVVVEGVALSTMVSNDLVMPVLLRLELLGLRRRGDLSGLILAVRRGAILLLVGLGYACSRTVAPRYGLASIGFVAFAGAAQFAPPILAGLYWRGAGKAGAVAGLLAGTAVWAYTLVLPALAEAGLLADGFVTRGPFGLGLLRPHALFGLEGLGATAHAVLWSLSANSLCLVLGSLFVRPGSLERVQAALFVEGEPRRGPDRLGGGEARVADLHELLTRFLGRERAEAAFAADARQRGYAVADSAPADAVLVRLTEWHLARAIGAASARIMVGSVVRGEVIGPGDLMEILDEASQLMDYSRRLEQKSEALERATAELKEAYDRLRQLDRLKDEFVATVSHELRTPLTSIRSFSEILLDTPDLSEEERRHFLGIVVRESDRLTRLVNDVLDLSKIEAGRMDWHVVDCNLHEVLEHAIAATSGVMAERQVRVATDLAPPPAIVRVDRDRLVQVVVNLLSNAAKFVPEEGGRVLVRLLAERGSFVVRVEDNGPGVPEDYRASVFERFRQVGGNRKGKPKGTGLGLTISREIVEHFGGRIWIEEAALGGAAVCFTLPEAASGRAAA